MNAPKPRQSRLALQLLAIGLGGCASGFGALTPAQIADRTLPSVVLIRTPTGLATGFVATPDGKIVTNFHVIRGAKQAIITTADHTEYRDVEVTAADEPHDLAVLQIPASNLQPLTLADSSLVKPGEHVVAIGNPLGLGGTVSDGLLSAIRQAGQVPILQISAPISPGSSGGPVLDDRGQVIGVSTFLIKGGQNLNFAVAINAVRPMLASNHQHTLAEIAAMTPVRHVPSHPANFLDRCPVAQIKTMIDAMRRAVQLGGPLYDQGNAEAAYRIYESAALDIQHTTPDCAGPKQALSDGLAAAETKSKWTEKVWAMRDSYDGIVAAVVKIAKHGSFGIARHIPDVAQSVIDECPADDVSGISTAISSAIASGAPLYNEGNHEACYRIYAGAISEIDRKYPNCPAAIQVLNTGLRTADQLSTYEPKAWALRDAFDGLMNAINKSQSGEK
jgi:S1-C subfamily serine protease